ncbi:uncharacterized protein BJ171DRAFT_640221 [Polychytrium aggregatum]|uniref:uncharacterized protein n=1 Tax=Polychytrium aggregatum TaxID=110093 RepID=UPI0022FE8786|nr:uncharacterized protein BJ171DRAFT_640221 [Polychytrium aggregatum]KAI9207343.1 hypothetical protein BJ171DRAFT_640221 [Polychytrium aggregatum]
MSFIIVKYGANEEKILNPNCLCSVLLNHIKKAPAILSALGLQHPFSEPVDLALETGEVIDLLNKPREYAKRFVEPRGVYVLVKVVSEETEETVAQYVPLLEQTGDSKVKYSLSSQSRQKYKYGKYASGSTGQSIADSNDSGGGGGGGGGGDRKGLGGKARRYGGSSVSQSISHDASASQGLSSNQSLSSNSMMASPGQSSGTSAAAANQSSTLSPNSAAAGKSPHPPNSKPDTANPRPPQPKRSVVSRN